MKAHCFRKWYFFVPLALLAAVGIGFIIMLLWNSLIPIIFNLPTITFWQALGLLILSRILLGGFGGHGKRHHHQMHKHMREKWENMTPEERERFHQNMHHHAWCCKKSERSNSESNI